MLEIMIAISIVAITAAIGWGSMEKHMPRFRLISSAKGMKADFMMVQSLAVQTNRETRLRLVDSAGSCEDMRKDLHEHSNRCAPSNLQIVATFSH